MSEAIQPGVRERLKDLNTKAYYLLVALSFLYTVASATWQLKIAISLTAAVAVLPVQDFVESPEALSAIRILKISFLTAALVLMLVWLCCTK